MLREKSRGAKDSLYGPPSALSTVGLAVVVGIAYFMAARLGLALRAATGTSVFWPALGLSVAALIVCGPGAAGSDRGAARAAAMSTLLGTAKLNDIDPLAWLADVLARIAAVSLSLFHSQGSSSTSRLCGVPVAA